MILFPSSCLYVRGKAVGFNMVDTGGTLNNLFVMEEYRNQGFGKEIQLDLMKKLIGCVEFKERIRETVSEME